MTPAPKPTKLVVAALLVRRAQQTLLVQQRPEGKPWAGYWEFPGGKPEEGEAAEAALIRELREELGITVAESDLQPFTFVTHAYESFQLMMPLYWCTRWQGEPAALEGQTLRWVRPSEAENLPLLPADQPLLPDIARSITLL